MGGDPPDAFRRGLSIKEIARRTGRDRNTVRKALRASEPPRYRRSSRPSKVDAFKPEIHRLLRDEPRLPGTRIRELLAEQGYLGSKTILDDYLREVRPLFAPRRAFQRTLYRPGELCQFDLWEPSRPLPVGHGQTRKGYVVVGCLPYSRVGAGALVFSKEAPDLLSGISRCLEQLEALPRKLVWDREGALHAGGGRPTEPFAAFCGQLRLGWHFLEPGDPEAKGCRAAAGLHRDELRAGPLVRGPVRLPRAARALVRRTGQRPLPRALRCRPLDRLPEELRAMRPLPERMPDVERRFVIRVPADPYLRLDTNDYSLDPRLLGRRIEVRVSQREVLAAALDTSELACRHVRSFARHRTISTLEDVRTLRELRGPARAGGRDAAARTLRGPDRGMTTASSELAFLFRALKAPAAARALPKLAGRAREEEWSYERFAEALLSTGGRLPRLARRRGPDQGGPLSGAKDA